MKATEEEVEAGAVEDGIIPGGEAVVTIDEVVPMSMLQEYSTAVTDNSRCDGGKDWRNSGAAQPR